MKMRAEAHTHTKAPDYNDFFKRSVANIKQSKNINNLNTKEKRKKKKSPTSQ
jgi:hypothetical protein